MLCLQIKEGNYSKVPQEKIDAVELPAEFDKFQSVGEIESTRLFEFSLEVFLGI